MPAHAGMTADASAKRISNPAEVIMSIRNERTLVVLLAALALFAFCETENCFAGSPKKVQLALPLGAAKSMPSSDQPVGWRGDGTGRYPGATPPITWERKPAGASYTTKGILWMQP